MPRNTTPSQKCGALLVVVLLVAMLVPNGSAAQTRWRSATLQLGLAGGSNSFVGLGLSVAAEVGVFRQLRVVGQWTDWQRLGCGAVQDAPSECSAQADLWQLGLRQGLGVAPRVAPYIGAGLGLYRRRATGLDDDPTCSPYLSIGAGFDFRVAAPATIRVSVVHQELFDDRVEESYGSGVRFTGILFGIGLAAW